MYGIHVDGAVVAAVAAPTAVGSNVRLSMTDAMSLQRWASLMTSQRWEVETALVPLSYDGQVPFAEIVARGLSVPVELVMPQNYAVIKKRSGSAARILLNNAGVKGGTTVELPAYSGFIPKGTFVRFGNGTKVYMTVNDLEGPGYLEVFPPLRTDLDATYMYHRDDVLMTCLLDIDTVQGMQYSDGILMSVAKIKMVEVLPTDAVEVIPEIATSTVYTVAVDTNGVVISIPELDVLHMGAPLETMSVFNAVVSGAAIVPTIAYVRHDQPLEEQLQVYNAAVTSALLTTVLAYVRHDQPREDELQVYNAVTGSAALTVVVAYIRHDQPLEDEFQVYNATVTGASLT